jgi:hypothetical protein
MQQNEVPIISGWKTSYRVGDVLRLNCTTRSQNAGLGWYIDDTLVTDLFFLQPQPLTSSLLIFHRIKCLTLIVVRLDQLTNLLPIILLDCSLKYVRNLLVICLVYRQPKRSLGPFPLANSLVSLFLRFFEC